MKFKLSLAIILLLSVFFISGSALAMTDSERQELIAQIQAQIEQLTQQLNQAMAQQQNTGTWCHTFNIDLDMGSSGSEVFALQTALLKEGFTISASEMQNQQFGATTGQAVKYFKARYSSQITTSGTTKVGEITRGMLNQLYGCMTSNICTNSDWTSVLSPSICPSDGTQVKIWNKIGNCSGGVNHPSTESVSCNYQTPTCSSFNYSNWSSCTQSGVQTRTIISSSPSGCVGGNPIISTTCTYTSACTDNDWTYALSPLTCPSSGVQTKTWTKIGSCEEGVSHPASETVTCTYTPPAPPCTESNWTYVLPSACSSSGTQVKTWSKIGNCEGGVSHPASETVGCNYQSSTCTLFTYSNWSTCNQSGVQTRTIVSVYPLGCAGGNPITSQVCTYSICPTNWSCGTWTTCINGLQRRTCTDLNNCGVLAGKPVESVSCNINCTPNWDCGAWSSNCLNGLKYRYCSDLNNCGVEANKPDITTSLGCTTTACNPKWICSGWVCGKGTMATRNCIDANSCGVLTGKPPIISYSQVQCGGYDPAHPTSTQDPDR